MVHSGVAVIHQVGPFAGVSGGDVILAHRLLKNSVPSDEYVLMTEPAYREIEFPRDTEVIRGEERYEGFGVVPTYTYLADGACAPKPETVERLYEDRAHALRLGLRILTSGLFGQVPILLGMRPPGHFNDLDELPVRPLARAGMAVRVILLSPVLYVIGVGVQADRALTRSARATRGQPARSR